MGKGVRNSDFFGNVFEKVTPPDTSNTWFTNKSSVVSAPAIISPFVFADQLELDDRGNIIMSSKP